MGLPPPDPPSLCPLSSTEFVEPPPPRTKFVGTPLRTRVCKSKGKAAPLQARRGPEGSRKLRFPVFVTTAQDGGRLSALRTG